MDLQAIAAVLNTSHDVPLATALVAGLKGRDMHSLAELVDVYLSPSQTVKVKREWLVRFTVQRRANSRAILGR